MEARPVMDFVRDNWKIASACALGALLLSLLIGLIAGNPFGAAILRAFLLCLLFAGLGVGARLVARTYLPELVTAPEGSQPETEAVRGRNVDIVLPEENGISRQTPRADTESGGADGVDEPLGDTDELSQEVVSPSEEQALGEIADELAEELPSATEQSAPEADELSVDGAEGRGSTGKGGPSGSAVGEDLDDLPDISNLEMASEEPQGMTGSSAGGRSSRGAVRGEKPGDALRGAVSGQDPATIARAIRTVLKKDEKG